MVKHYLSEQLGAFRGATSEADLNQSVALICVLLLGANDRAEFAIADGATALGDHLLRLCHEQAAARFKWKGSKAFGFTVSEKGLRQFVRFLLVSIVHASLEASMATQFCTANLPQVLYDEFVLPTDGIFGDQTTAPLQSNQESEVTTSNPSAAAPPPEVSLRVVALEALRNLCYVDWPRPQLNPSTLDKLWDMLFATNNESTDVDTGSSGGERQVACDILTNLASHAPRATHATKDRVAMLLELVLHTNDEVRVNLRAAGRCGDSNLCTWMATLVDLAANLARDTEYSIVLICSLEQLKPRTRVNTSSLAYLTQWADDAREDAGLRTSLRSLNHNLAWTDVSTKVCVQKLAASTFLERFLHVRANQ